MSYRNAFSKTIFRSLFLLLLLSLPLACSKKSRPDKATGQPVEKAELPPQKRANADGIKQFQPKERQETKKEEKPDFHPRFSENPAYFNTDFYHSTAEAKVEEERYYLKILKSELSSSDIECETSDSRLIVVARALSRYVAAYQNAPPERLVHFLLQRAGVAETNPAFFYFGSKKELADVEGFREGLRRWLSKIQPQRAFNRVGLGVGEALIEKSGERITYVTILGVRQTLEMKPVKKTAQLENRFFIEGSLAEGLPTDTQLALHLEFLGETLMQAPLELSGRTFKKEVQIPPAKAIYHLEITEKQVKGIRSLVFMKIHNKTPFPNRFSHKKTERLCKSTVECEALLMERINEKRLKLKKAPLARSETLIKHARWHAKDMMTHHYDSIHDRKGRSVQMRLEALGLSPMQAGEVVDGGYGFAGLLQSIDESPSLGDFLTNEMLTNIGCGVVKRDVKHGEAYFILSCIVATLIDEREGDTLKEAIYGKFNTLRKAEKRPAFQRAPGLEETAQMAVGSLLKKNRNERLIQETVKIRIEKSGLVKKRSVFGILTIFDLAQLESKPAVKGLISSEFTHLVLGVKKQTDIKKKYRGIFIYYMAFK